MSLPAHVRRERRAYNHQQDLAVNGPKKFPKRHCANCNKLYEKTQAHKKFCSPKCREEFRRYGGAFGPLRDWLEKLIGEEVKKRYVETAGLSKRIEEVTTTSITLVRKLAAVEQLLNATRAELSETNLRVTGLEEAALKKKRRARR